MAFLRPVTKTVISTTEFGQPVYDALIRTGASRSGIQSSMAAGVITPLTWSTTIADTGGFISSTQNVIIPADKAGVYAASITLTFSAATAGCYMSIMMAANRYDLAVAGGGRTAAVITQPLAVGETVSFSFYNGTAAALPVTASRCDVYRVSL